MFDTIYWIKGSVASFGVIYSIVGAVVLINKYLEADWPSTEIYCGIDWIKTLLFLFLCGPAAVIIGFFIVIFSLICKILD